MPDHQRTIDYLAHLEAESRSYIGGASALTAMAVLLIRFDTLHAFGHPVGMFAVFVLAFISVCYGSWSLAFAHRFRRLVLEEAVLGVEPVTGRKGRSRRSWGSRLLDRWVSWVMAVDTDDLMKSPDLAAIGRAHRSILSRAMDFLLVAGVTFAVVLGAKVVEIVRDGMGGAA